METGFDNQVDLASGWAIGAWEKIGDTILLTPMPIMDTLSRTMNSDSLCFH